MFFLFKQKTAYELRISDLSSDVCSSDLAAHRLADAAETRARGVRAGLAVTRHAHDDQPGVGLAKVGGVEIPFFERAGAEILDEDIGLRDQLADRTSGV